MSFRVKNFVTQLISSSIFRFKSPLEFIKKMYASLDHNVNGVSFRVSHCFFLFVLSRPRLNT